jgi:transposase
MGVKRRNDDDEFKQAAIRLVTVNGHGVSETARNLGINTNMLSRWKREEEAKQHAASTGNDLTREEQQELRQLRGEVKRLRMERDILKKALGYFANESN